MWIIILSVQLKILFKYSFKARYLILKLVLKANENVPSSVITSHSQIKKTVNATVNTHYDLK